MIKNNSPLTRLSIFKMNSVQMRTFHITWLTFFACFFGWFGLAPLMPTIRQDLGIKGASPNQPKKQAKNVSHVM